MMLATEIRKLVKIDVPSSGSSFWKINKYFEMMLATEIRKLVKIDVLDDIDFCIAWKSVEKYCINPGHCSTILSKAGFRVNYRESTCLRNAWVGIPSSS